MNTIENLNNKIRSGKKFLYRNDVIELKGFQERSGIFYISATRNGKEHQVVKDSVEKLETYLNNLIEFEEIAVVETELDIESKLPAVTSGKSPATKEKASQILEKNSEAFESLTSILMEDIKKVRQDPGYVSQAKQVANSAQTIVNLVKLQLDIISKG